MIYTYQIVGTPDTIEIEHPISQPALTTYEIDGQEFAVKRLISGGTNFILKGDTWARNGYERGIQNPAKEAAEAHRSEKK